MLRYDVLQNPWAWLAVAGGVVLVLATVLAWAAFLRPREAPRESEGGAAPAAPFSARVPWFLVLVIGGLLAWAIVYVLVHAAQPPNW